LRPTSVLGHGRRRGEIADWGQTVKVGKALFPGIVPQPPPAPDRPAERCRTEPVSPTGEHWRIPPPAGHGGHDLARPIWDQLFPAEQQFIVRLLVEKVIVSPNDIEVRLRANGIEDLALELGPAVPVGVAA